MKKVLFTTLLFLSATCSFSQIQKGKVLLTGTLSYVKSGDFDQYEVGLSGGYFVSDKAAIGVSANFGKTIEFDVDLLFYGEMESKGFSVFSRHYFNMGDESKFYFFLQPSFNYLKNVVDDDFSGDEYEFESKFIAVSPGFSFYPSSRVGIELSLNGLIYQLGEDGGSNTFAIDLKPLSPTLGITFLLGKE